MGKAKRNRKKFHILPNSKTKTSTQSTEKKDSASQPPHPERVLNSDMALPMTPPKDNLFAGINIDFNSLNKLDKPKEDLETQSVKSYKSAKSEGSNKVLPKKEKLKLRRSILLKKIDTVNQMKKELKIREKRKQVAIIGDTNPLRDALPSLEYLLKNRSDIKVKSNRSPAKKKGIEKARKRKKELVQGVQVFKNVLKNKKFQKNPFEVVSQHVKAVVQHDINSLKQKKLNSKK